MIVENQNNNTQSFGKNYLIVPFIILNYIHHSVNKLIK